MEKKNSTNLEKIQTSPYYTKIHVAQKNVIEEKLLEIKRSIRRGMYLFQIRTVFFLHNYH